MAATGFSRCVAAVFQKRVRTAMTGSLIPSYTKCDVITRYLRWKRVPQIAGMFDFGYLASVSPDAPELQASHYAINGAGISVYSLAAIAWRLRRLRCPFCSWALEIVQDSLLKQHELVVHTCPLCGFWRSGRLPSNPTLHFSLPAGASQTSHQKSN